MFWRHRTPSPTTPDRRPARTLSAGTALFLSTFFFFPAPGSPVLGSDAGEADWSEPAALAPKSLLLDAVKQGDRMIAVGERGHVLVSEDGGSTWSQAKVPTRTTLTGVTLLKTGQAWAVGHDAVILHSPDGGKTWTRQYADPDEGSPLLDVWFEDTQHGLAVGAYALVLETTDGGKTWEQRTVDEEEHHWNAIGETRDGTLFAAAEAGAFFRSADKGRTWESLSTPYQGSFFGLLELADGSLLVFGLRGHLYRSPDRGQTWLEIHTRTTTTLMNGILHSDGGVILVGLSGTVLVSRDGGQTFEPRNRPDRLGLAAVLEPGGRGLLLFGEGGIVQLDDWNN